MLELVYISQSENSMTTYFVTRHSGAVAWANHRHVYYDVRLAELDVSRVHAGDTVIGTLPIHLVAEVCERGARYVNLALDVPLHLRGKELSNVQLHELNARLQAFDVRTLPSAQPAAGDSGGRSAVVGVGASRARCFVAVVTGQNLANLPPLFHLARPGDELIWLPTQPAAAAQIGYAAQSVERRGLSWRTAEPMCPSDPARIGPWVRASLLPAIAAERDIVLIGNGGTKPMFHALQQALGDRLVEVIYGEGSPVAALRFPDNDAANMRYERFGGSAVTLDDVIECSGHRRKPGSRPALLWRDGGSLAPPWSQALPANPARLVVAYERHLDRERIADIDPQELTLNDVRRLLGPERAARERLEPWCEAIVKAGYLALRDAHDQRIRALSDVEAPDPDALRQAMDDLADAAQQAAGRAQLALTASAADLDRIRRSGELGDDDVDALARRGTAVVVPWLERLAAQAAIPRGAQNAVFERTMQLLKQALAAKSAAAAPRREKARAIRGLTFEYMVADRTLRLLAARPEWHGVLSEVWHGVELVSQSGKTVAEWDVLLVLRNGVLVNIECKAGVTQPKDLDARTTVIHRGASTLATLWVCSPLPTQFADQRWFETPHEVRAEALAAGRPHLPFTLAGQPASYRRAGREFSCPPFESEFERLFERYVLSEAGAAKRP